MRKVLPAILIGSLLLVAGSAVLAGDHSHKGKRFKDATGFKTRGAGDHGNEATGQTAAWLLLAVNLTVIASMAMKGAARFLPLEESTKKSLAKINQRQKSYLMKLHYFANPVILAVAALHWFLSRCRTTSLPEWGLICMLVLAAMGLILKFKLAPQGPRKLLYRVHTHPAAVSSVVLILFCGHLLMD